MLDALILSRLQFAFTVSFHIIFPAFSIGLASFLVVMEGLWLKTKTPIYYQIIRFWTKVFALTFGMGVVSGIVMEFQLGTNWAGFAKLVGSVLGPLFVYEVLSAFFIEAGFIGIMIFGWNKVGEKLHYFATLMVTLGTTISAYWIMSANSWMQHPVGFEITAGKFVATNWLAIVFNPYTFPRFIHMLLAAYLATSFVIISISCYYLLKGQFVEFAQKCLSSAVIMVMLVIPLQILVGDQVGVNIYHQQPLKTAAIEGLWETRTGAPTILLAFPSNKEQKNLFELGQIPYGSAILNTHSLNGKLIGLKMVKPQEQPMVWPVFYSFRIMTGLGLIMLAYAIWTSISLRKGQLFTNTTLLTFGKYMAPTGFIAIVAGWLTAEIGRQPWVVYGVLKTTDAISTIAMHDVIISFILIFIVYGIIFGYFYFYFLDKTIKQGPADFASFQPFQFMHNTKPVSGEQ